MDARAKDQRADTFRSSAADIAGGNYSIWRHGQLDGFGGKPRALVPNTGFDQMHFDILQSSDAMGEASDAIMAYSTEDFEDGSCRSKFASSRSQDRDTPHYGSSRSCPCLRLYSRISSARARPLSLSERYMDSAQRGK